MTTRDAEETIRDYYEALREGDPLYPYFTDAGSVVKFGISERLAGYDAVVEGLREQTRHTGDWTVRSRDLRVTERDCHAWFSDDVFMAWTDTGTDYAFDSRWSGTMEHRDDNGWSFVGMHVSVPHDL